MASALRGSARSPIHSGKVEIFGHRNGRCDGCTRQRRREQQCPCRGGRGVACAGIVRPTSGRQRGSEPASLAERARQPAPWRPSLQLQPAVCRVRGVAGPAHARQWWGPLQGQQHRASRWQGALPAHGRGTPERRPATTELRGLRQTCGQVPTPCQARQVRHSSVAGELTGGLTRARRVAAENRRTALLCRRPLGLQSTCSNATRFRVRRDHSVCMRQPPNAASQAASHRYRACKAYAEAATASATPQRQATRHLRVPHAHIPPADSRRLTRRSCSLVSRPVRRLLRLHRWQAVPTLKG